jgi:hypothetical protein
MLRNEDLNAAVDAGVITKEQAATLRQQAASGSGQQAASGAGRQAADVTDSETPRVTRGFNDVMLALGTAIITVALMSQWGLPGSTIAPAVYATIPVLWVISELLDVRRKAVLPGIVAVIGMSCAAAYIGSRYGWSQSDTARNYTSLTAAFNFSVGVTLWMAAAVAAMNALYYARFRLPFALLPLALGVGIACVQALILLFGWDTTAAIPQILGLVFGLLLFAAAMWYDTSDPQRRTRNADCGFWLHMAAAPLIVHSLLSIFGGTALAKSGIGSGLTVALIAGITLVALAIDRRALIVSSLGYLLAAVSYVVATASQLLGGSTFSSLIVLGVVVLVVGMGWHPARRAILAPFRGRPWLAKLPPVKA